VLLKFAQHPPTEILVPSEGHSLKVLMNLTSSSLAHGHRRPRNGRNELFVAVRIRFAFFTIVRLIPQSRNWETNCAYAPPVVRGRVGLTFTHNFRGYLVWYYTLLALCLNRSDSV
jgi:hypothetical protein